MLREFAWRAFEKTGSADTYVFYKEIEVKDNIIRQDAFMKNEAAASNSDLPGIIRGI